MTTGPARPGRQPLARRRRRSDDPAARADVRAAPPLLPDPRETVNMVRLHTQLPADRPDSAVTRLYLGYALKDLYLRLAGGVIREVGPLEDSGSPAL